MFVGDEFNPVVEDEYESDGELLAEDKKTAAGLESYTGDAGQLGFWFRFRGGEVPPSMFPPGHPF